MSLDKIVFSLSLSTEDFDNWKLRTVTETFTANSPQSCEECGGRRSGIPEGADRINKWNAWRVYADRDIVGTRERASQNPLFATPFRHPASVGHLTDCVKISSLIWSHQSPLVYPPFFGIPNLLVSIGILQSPPLPVPVSPALTIPAPPLCLSFSSPYRIIPPPLCALPAWSSGWRTGIQWSTECRRNSGSPQPTSRRAEGTAGLLPWLLSYGNAIQMTSEYTKYHLKKTVRSTATCSGASYIFWSVVLTRLVSL